MAEIACVVEGKNRLGESPVWSVRENALYWVDSRAPAVYRLDPDDGAVTSVKVPAVIGSIGLRGTEKQLVAALQNGFHFLDFSTGALTAIVDPESGQPDNRFGAGRVDRRGRFWGGTMNDKRREPTGSLYRLDPNSRCFTMRMDIVVPNSLCWSPGDARMYFADTYRNYIWVYDFDVNSGTIANPRPFLDTTGNAGRPHGSSVDTDGCVWNAATGSGRIVRYTPGGSVDREIELPVSNPTSCTFGGPNLDVLYVTTGTLRATPEQLAEEPLAGGLFAIDAKVSGLPEPEFAA